jgi:hypothetical protein
MTVVALGQGATNALVVVGLITAVAGAVAVLLLVVMLANVILPGLIWATVKRLHLSNPDGVDRAAATIASSRKAWMLRIPYGVRFVVSLGGKGREQMDILNDLAAARRARVDREKEGTDAP